MENMPKNKFIKNLYNVISYLLLVIFFTLIIIVMFICSLEYTNDTWFLLVIAIGLLLLFFLIGGYWIFQKVEIDYYGIKITLFKKILRDIKWEDVDTITYTSVARNPVYAISIKNSKQLNLDSRKKIITAIKYFSNEEINQKIEDFYKNYPFLKKEKKK